MKKKNKMNHHLLKKVKKAKKYFKALYYKLTKAILQFCVRNNPNVSICDFMALQDNREFDLRAAVDVQIMGNNYYI